MVREKEGSTSPLGLPTSNTPFAGAPHQQPLLLSRERDAQMNNNQHHGQESSFPASSSSGSDSGVPSGAAPENSGGRSEGGVQQSLPPASLGTQIGSFLGPAPAEPMLQPNRGERSQRKFSPMRSSQKIRQSAKFTSDSLVPDGTRPTPMIDLTAPLDVMSSATLEIRRTLLVEELERVDYTLELRRRQQREELIAKEQQGVAPSGGHYPINVNTVRHKSPTRRGNSPPSSLGSFLVTPSGSGANHRHHHQEEGAHVVMTPPSIMREGQQQYTTSSTTTHVHPYSSTTSTTVATETAERRRAMASELRAQALSLMNSTSRNKLINSTAAPSPAASAVHGSSSHNAAATSDLRRSYSPAVINPHEQQQLNHYSEGPMTLVTASGNSGGDGTAATGFHLVHSPRVGYGGTTGGQTGGGGGIRSGGVSGIGGGANPVVMEELYRLRMKREATH